MKILGIADSDSYVKWGAATLARAPREWDASFVILDTPFVPTEAQRAAAVDGLLPDDPPVLSLAALTDLVAAEQPEVIFLSLRGPMIRVALRAVLSVSERRPVLVSGLPGISIPATRKALTFRSQVDLVLLHSKRELRDFPEVAQRLGLEQRFGLATLPFFSAPRESAARPDAGPDVRPDARRDEIVFAAQAKVPRLRTERVAILAWLAETARRHPDRRVVIKLRAVGDEKQTHAEQYPYDALLAELPARPANLVAESGSMAAHLDRAIGLVTVSSTALLEAAAIGVPGLAINDFGVSNGLINVVFEGSNMLGPAADLVQGRFRLPDPAWLDDNYFHDPAEDDWIVQIEELAAARERAPLSLKKLRYGQAGGRLRHVWDRKRALGSLDRSAAGYLALVIGYPVRALVRIARRGRALVHGVRRSVVADPIE